MLFLCVLLSNIVVTDFKLLNCAMFPHLVSVVNNTIYLFQSLMFSGLVVLLYDAQKQAVGFNILSLLYCIFLDKHKI